MKIKVTSDEVRMLIDVLKGEEMRMHELIRDYPSSGDWYERRLEAVGNVKDRLKAIRRIKYTRV